MVSLSVLNTEQQNPNTRHIDKMQTLDILKAINNEDKLVAAAVEKALPQVAVLVDKAFERLMDGGRIIYVGAGTSGRLGVLDASECPPTYGVPPTLFSGVIAGGPEALVRSVEGAEDSKEMAVNDLKAVTIGPKDTVIGLAASGRTPYVIGALEYAKKIGALTGAVSAVENAAVSAAADVGIEAVTGPEVIMGSTRMKAGTMQKLVVNMISTSLMVKYGKVYDNLMIDVAPSNEKLVKRACKIIMLAAGCTEEEAAEHLDHSGSNVKLAVCMALSNKDKPSCEDMLAANRGNVSKTIHALKHGAVE